MMPLPRRPTTPQKRRQPRPSRQRKPNISKPLLAPSNLQRRNNQTFSISRKRASSRRNANWTARGEKTLDHPMINSPECIFLMRSGTFCCKQPQFVNAEKLFLRKHTQQEIETSYQFFETGIATLANPTISPSPEGTQR